MQSTKELKEILAGMKEGFKAGKAIRDIVKDGIDISDLPKSFELVKTQAEKLEIYEAAIKDAKLAKEEIQDLDKAEIVELLMILIEGIEEVEAA
jgi:hypothetical protein